MRDPHPRDHRQRQPGDGDAALTKREALAARAAALVVACGVIIVDALPHRLEAIDSATPGAGGRVMALVRVEPLAAARLQASAQDAAREVATDAGATPIRAPSDPSGRRA